MKHLEMFYSIYTKKKDNPILMKHLAIGFFSCFILFLINKVSQH